LARALYGEPALIVLDEPNSNLDEHGEKALMEAIQGLKRRKASVFIITHRPNILAVVDKLMVLNSGIMQVFGPRDEVLAHLKQKANPQAAPAVKKPTTVTI
jgi:ATP-binding cassette subfamily C protein EexD